MTDQKFSMPDSKTRTQLNPDLLRFVTNLAIAEARRDHLIAMGVLQPNGREKATSTTPLRRSTALRP